MKPISTLITVLILLSGCSNMPKNRALDKFVWDIQYAGDENDKVKEMGETDMTSFTSEVEKFPWYEQAVKANKLHSSSPTLSVNDLKTDKSLFVSSGTNEQGEDFGYFLGYIYPDSKNSLYVMTYSVDEMDDVQALIRSFFERDYNTLTRLLDKQELFLESPSSKSWKVYLTEKEKYY